MAGNLRETTEELRALLERSPVTAGLEVSIRGQHLVLSRRVDDEPGQVDLDPRLRLTDLGQRGFGLSVRRHTGQWEQVPFAGSLEELVEVICGPMQHLVARG